jgi:hypothetical protein
LYVGASRTSAEPIDDAGDHEGGEPAAGRGRGGGGFAVLDGSGVDYRVSVAAVAARH